MKKLIVATGVALTTVLGASFAPASHDALTNDAQAATQDAYYNVEGYTANDSSFLVDPNFVNALKTNSLKLNGYKVDLAEIQGTPNLINKQVYDQNVLIDPNTNTMRIVGFNTKKGQISKAQIEQAYGTNYNFEHNYPGSDGKTDPNNGQMQYDLNGYKVDLLIEEGTVSHVYLNAPRMGEQQ